MRVARAAEDIEAVGVTEVNRDFQRMRVLGVSMSWEEEPCSFVF